jgi:hypothetical protein
MPVLLHPILWGKPPPPMACGLAAIRPAAVLYPPLPLSFQPAGAAHDLFLPLQNPALHR